MDRSAVAYQVNGKLIIAPVKRSSAGVGLEVNPVAVSEEADGSIVASLIGDALDSSAHTVPHPTQDQWKGFFEPFLKAACVRSHKAFMNGARRVSIRATDELLKLTPQRNLGSKGGFEPIPDSAIILPPEDFVGAAEVLKNLQAAGSR